MILLFFNFAQYALSEQRIEKHYFEPYFMYMFEAVGEFGGVLRRLECPGRQEKGSENYTTFQKKVKHLTNRKTCEACKGYVPTEKGVFLELFILLSSFL